MYEVPVTRESLRPGDSFTFSTLSGPEGSAIRLVVAAVPVLSGIEFVCLTSCAISVWHSNNMWCPFKLNT